MEHQSDEKKIKYLQDFIKDESKKLLIYDNGFEMFITYLPDGYIIKEDRSIWLEEPERMSSDLILLIKRK